MKIPQIFSVFAKTGLTGQSLSAILSKLSRKTRTSGGLAQLGERLHGMQEVTGSIPVFSTTKAATLVAAFFFYLAYNIKGTGAFASVPFYCL